MPTFTIRGIISFALGALNFIFTKCLRKHGPGVGEGGGFGALASPDRTTLPLTSEKFSSGKKMEFIKGGPKFEPILGTQTFFGP